MFPRLQLPTEGELSPSEINSLISTANTIRKIDLESRAAARRYRGQQQLQALIGQGVPMDQAMQRVAADLFYQRPQEQMGMLRQLEFNQRQADRSAVERQRLDIMRQHYNQMALKPPPPTLQQKAEAAARAKLAAQDFSIWKTKHDAAVRGLALAQNALRKHYADQNTIQNADKPQKREQTQQFMQNVNAAQAELAKLLKQRPAVGPSDAPIYDNTDTGDEVSTPEPDVEGVPPMPDEPAQPVTPPPPAAAAVKRWVFNPQTRKIEPVQ